jgi:hypothetical protein
MTCRDFPGQRVLFQARDPETGRFLPAVLDHTPTRRAAATRKNTTGTGEPWEQTSIDLPDPDSDPPEPVFDPLTDALTDPAVWEGWT